MPKEYNRNVLEVIRITRSMMLLADKGDQDREDEGCGVMYGTLRDAAFKLRKLAEKEREEHILADCWDCDVIQEK